MSELDPNQTGWHLFGADREQISRLVESWMPRQRWFAGKGREAKIALEPLAELHRDPQVLIWTAQVDYADSDESELYQIPLVTRDRYADDLEHALVGTVETEFGTRWLYDALHDKQATATWLTGIRDGSAPGQLHFTRDAASPDDIPVGSESLALSGEQSNTSLVYGDAAILKVFRRLQPGVNPDIEVLRELSKLGAKHIARLLGSVETDIDDTPTSLAMLQEFMTTATDGWVLATASVRNLMAEGDLHADEAGGDFAGEAERLGAAVAAIHTDLETAFGSRRASSEELAQRAEAMRARLRWARDIVPELQPLAPALDDTYSEVAELAASGTGVRVQRIHGDLHLGQALRTVYRWVIIDFEGEPMAEIDARRSWDSPLRDIAGMLRSFEYAGHHTVTDGGAPQQRAYRANEWSQRNRDAFCAGYAAAADADPREAGVLLRAFEADKAVYEAVYEARNRPGWLPIPLASLSRLSSPAATSTEEP